MAEDIGNICNIAFHNFDWKFQWLKNKTWTLAQTCSNKVKWKRTSWN